MFDKQYTIKVYLGGQLDPLVEFRVVAQSVKVKGTTLSIDGVVLDFGPNHYVAVTL
jgi:hypothetical protein